MRLIVCRALYTHKHCVPTTFCRLPFEWTRTLTHFGMHWRTREKPLHSIRVPNFNEIEGKEKERLKICYACLWCNVSSSTSTLKILFLLPFFSFLLCLVGWLLFDHKRVIGKTTHNGNVTRFFFLIPCHYNLNVCLIDTSRTHFCNLCSVSPNTAEVYFLLNSIE